MIAFLAKIPELKTMSAAKPAVMIPSPDDQRLFMEVYLIQNQKNRNFILDSLKTRETGTISLRTFEGSNDMHFFFYSSRFLGILAAAAHMDVLSAANVLAQQHETGTQGDDFVRMAFGRFEPATPEGREVYENWRVLRVEQ